MIATKRIPIIEAYLCESCQCVCNSAVQCECGSSALLSMNAVLNRETAREMKDLELFGEVAKEPAPADFGFSGLRMVRR